MPEQSPAIGADASRPSTVTIARGNIYLSRAVYERYFAQIQGVALLYRDGNLLLAPLIRESGGGLLLKIRNARGDRVVHAQEFFRDKGLLEDFVEREMSARWDAEMAALIVADVPRA